MRAKLPEVINQGAVVNLPTDAPLATDTNMGTLASISRKRRRQSFSNDYKLEVLQVVFMFHSSLPFTLPLP